VVKASWGTKRTCPKCGTRFYDLGNEEPVVCIECANEWTPEPILKSRQPQMEDQKEVEMPEEDIEDSTDEDLVLDEDEDANPDDDIDLDDGGDVPNVMSNSTEEDPL